MIILLWIITVYKQIKIKYFEETKPTLNLETNHSVGGEGLRKSFVVYDIDRSAVEVWLLNFYSEH